MDVDTLVALCACPIFDGLSQDEVVRLMHAVRYRLVRYSKGSVVAIAGDVCNRVDIVMSGELVAMMSTPSGRVLRMGLHHSGHVVAPAFAFAKDNRYPVTVEAAADTVVLRVSADDMRAIMAIDERVAINYLGLVSNIAAFLSGKLAMMSMTVREKLMDYLNGERVRQRANPIVLPCSRQQLAEQFGIQKFSLQRCLAELQDEGIVAVEGRRVRFLG